MKVGEAFTYLREDPEWLNKLIVAVLLSLTLIGFIPVMGWGAEITHRLIHGRRDFLPAWSDFGELTVTGLKLIATNFVWWLPVTVFYAPFMVFPFFATWASELSADGSFETLFSTLPLGIMCLMPLIMALQFSIVALSPAYRGQFAAEKSVADGLDIKQVWGNFKSNWANYAVVAILGTWVPAMLANLGMFFFCIGYFVALVYGQTVRAYLDAIVYLDTQAKSAIP
jgi:hypothetical protein